MSELKTVVGTVSGITEKPSGWIEVQVALPGKQYPVKLATKKVELIEDVRMLGTGVGTFSYNEVESDKINEHTGKPYVNRYLEEVQVGAHAASAGPTAPPTASGSAPQVRYTDDEIKRFEDKERRDYRSRAWAQAIAAMTHTIPSGATADDVYETVKPLQRKIYEDICGSFAYPPVGEDDDIPFE